MELTRAVSKIVGELLNDPNQSKAVIDYIVYHHTPYRSAFDFHTRAEYDEYVQSVELRTLSGVLVNSFEELVIANYLTEHGVEFRYEDPYMVPTATRQRGQYRPDFFLPDYAIYIEHFALNEQGRPPPGWRQYAEDVEWKRSTHRLNRSKLTETYSWQHRQGVLLPTLRKQLEEEGVCFERIPRQTLVRRLAEEQTSRLTGLLAMFLNHVKSSGLSPDVSSRPRPSRPATVGATRSSSTSSTGCVPATSSSLRTRRRWTSMTSSTALQVISARVDGSRSTGTYW